MLPKKTGDNQAMRPVVRTSLLCLAVSKLLRFRELPT